MNPCIRHPLGALLPFLFAGLVDSVAVAQESAVAPAHASNRAFRAKLHAALPFGQINLIDLGSGSGRISSVAFAGGSFEAELRRLWAVEVGGAYSLSIGGNFPTDYDVFARAGLVPIVYDARDRDGLGWTIQLDALAGYRWLKRHQSADGYLGTETTHGIRGNLGLDFSRQFPGFALGARLLSGVTLPLAQTRTGYWYMYKDVDLKWALDLGIDIGIAL